MYFYFLFLLLIQNISSQSYICVLYNTEGNILQCVKLNPYNHMNNHINTIENSNNNIEYFYKIVNDQSRNYDDYYQNPNYNNHPNNFHEEY